MYIKQRLMSDILVFIWVGLQVASNIRDDDIYIGDSQILKDYAR